MAGRAVRGRGRVGEEGRITGERGRIGGTRAIIPVSLLSSSNPFRFLPPSTTVVVPSSATHAVLGGEAKVLNNISSSMSTGRGLRTIRDLGQGVNRDRGKRHRKIQNKRKEKGLM
jgi:hypothetical protein